MTPIYEVETRHTKKVLEDFLKFTYKIKHPHVTIKLLILAVGFGVIAYMSGGNAGTYICGILGITLAVIALSRKKIGMNKLMKADTNYQNQSVINFVFGESEFRVVNTDLDQNQRVRYGEISYMYADDTNYYISVNNEEIHLIPKADFVTGDSDGFYEFISNKTGKPIRPMYIPWKVRYRMMMEYRDLRAEEVKKSKEGKKRK